MIANLIKRMRGSVVVSPATVAVGRYAKKQNGGATMEKTYYMPLWAVMGNARSQNGWLDQPVTEAQLRAVHDLAKWAPTSMNCQPLRILFLQSMEMKQRLAPALAPTNVAKVLSAPVVAILAYDNKFYDLLPEIFAHRPEARDYYAGPEKAVHAETAALRNSSIQATYFMLAARAIGLDCGPISGFKNAVVDAEFFAGTAMKSNFLCCLGKGDPTKVYDRLPRLAFDRVCQII